MAMNFGLTGVASSDLGYGGDLLGQQAQNETEEQRKKRLLAMQQQHGMPGAVSSLFGTPGGRGGGPSFGP